ncbi:DUF6461 domain-containing protein [Pseudonocardia humida]|uniref:Uncharacterized protein n=1 Tax=Pseudonocardia humida TaxID=2800819 RepID=A0ABT1A2Z7_9PSEU|nr:DUF6461 domain-containing protein [Pseudonocardia humida]MCO1657384.1 hypothetical protein [Pseudonocardia humida]
MTSGVSGWAWTARVYPGGYQLSFAEGRTAAEMLAAFGVDPAAARMMTPLEAFEEFEGDPGVFRAGETGGWGFAVEEYTDPVPEQLLALSVGTRAVSVFRNLAGPHALSYFEDGAATFACEPLFPRWRHGSDADRFLEPMRAVGFDPDVEVDLDAFDPDMAALDLLTVAFGIRLTEEQMTGPLLTGEVEIDMSWLDP